MGGRGAKSATTTAAKTTKPKEKKPAPYQRPAPSPNETVIVSKEDANRKRKTEKMTIVDSNGKVAYEQGGGKTSVRFSASVIPPGSVLTHNHPEGGASRTTTFSPADVNSFENINNIVEMRATDKYGAYILRKRPGLVATESGSFTQAFERFMNTVERTNQTQRKRLVGLLSSRARTSEDVNKEWSDIVTANENSAKRWLAQNAKKFGYEYDYRPRGK